MLLVAVETRGHMAWLIQSHCPHGMSRSVEFFVGGVARPGRDSLAEQVGVRGKRQAVSGLREGRRGPVSARAEQATPSL